MAARSKLRMAVSSRVPSPNTNILTSHCYRSLPTHNLVGSSLSGRWHGSVSSISEGNRTGTGADASTLFGLRNSTSAVSPVGSTPRDFPSNNHPAVLRDIPISDKPRWGAAYRRKHQEPPTPNTRPASSFQSQQTHRKKSTRSGRRGPSPDPTDRYINIGRATRVIRDEIPRFPDHGLSDFDIYAETVTFVEPYRAHFRCKGKTWYKTFAGTMHAALKVAFVDADMTILAIHQRGGGGMGGKGVISGEGADGLPSPSEGNGSHQRPGDIREGSSLEDHGAEADAYDVQLVVRWIFEGTPRHLLIADDSPPRSVYEGVFVYSFDQHGLVKEHRLEAINPAPPFVASWKAMFGGGMPAAPGATSLPGASAPAATLKAMGNAREVHG